MSWLLKAWRILKGPAGDLLKALIKVITEIVTGELYALVKEAVEMVQNDPGILNDSEKREAALAYLKDKAGKRGIFIRDSIGNLLIEAYIQVRKIFSGG